MTRKRKIPCLIVIWESVPDPDCREQLRRAFEIILGNDIQPPYSRFDENQFIGQDEPKAGKRPGANQRRSSNET